MAKVLWTQKQDMGPLPRVGHAMTYDASRQRVVLFGGSSPDTALFGDTWEWDGESWTQVQDIGPSARAFHALAFDTTRRRSVLFGGRNAAGLLGDTWEWDGNAWTEESDFGPDPCAGGAIVFKGSRAALFGGIASIASPPPQPAPAIFDRSWEWDGRHWTARQDMGPGDRVFHAMAFDEARSRVVLFGGSTVPTGGDGVQAGLRGDTWEQFEEGQATGSGPALVEIAAIDVVPNPAPAGVTVLITVTLTSPAAAEATVLVLANGMEIGTIAIGADQASGTFELPIPAGEPAGTVMLAARIGTSEAETTLEVLGGGGTVEVAAIDAQPNPITGGQTLAVTVTLANPATEPANVDLLVDGQLFAQGNIAIQAGATSGQVSIPVSPGSPAMTFELTARSGQTQASVQVTIQ